MHSAALPRRRQPLQGACLSQRSLRPLQKVQLSMGLSRLLVWNADCAITSVVPVVAGIRHAAEWETA